MDTTVDILDLIDNSLATGAKWGLMQLQAEGDRLDGREIILDGQRVINFGSCSYLGLERDPRLIEGVVEAVRRYGTQFSSSRGYVSAPPYAELEATLSQLFGGRVLTAPSTSLGHVSALPTLIGKNDAVILDQQVHHSVQTAAQLLRPIGTTVAMIRHNRIDQLVEQIEELRLRHRHVWYLADGLYSMYATVAPFGAIAELLERYPQFHVYFDDSHGVGWSGRNGRGLVLEALPPHPRMVVAASLNKSFAASGAALVFFDEAKYKRVRNCGGPSNFSGPIQPPMLGALLASARLHLSEDLDAYQAELKARIRLANSLLSEAGMPVVSQSEAPIRCVGLGAPVITYKVAQRLLRDGFYLNIAVFPGVSMKRSGLRITITRHQHEADIVRLVEAIAHHVPIVLGEENSSLEEVRGLFDLPAPLPTAAPISAPTSELTIKVAAGLRLEHATSIREIDANDWDSLLGDRGTFDSRGLCMLETAFAGHGDPATDWNFHYFMVRDTDGKVVLATFFSEALWKDDMLYPEGVSRLVEARRAVDPGYLTSRIVGMGSLLTEGNHLYLDRTRDWRGAFGMLLKAISDLQSSGGANTVILRDLSADAELADWIEQQGFAKFKMPLSLSLSVEGQTEEDWWTALTTKARYQQRTKVLPWNDAYDVELLNRDSRRPDERELAHLHGLYRNVQAKHFELNTFPLPENLLGDMLLHEGWEIVTLTLRPEAGGSPGMDPIGMFAGYRGSVDYTMMLVGMDYTYAHQHGTYRQLMRRAIERARQTGAKRALLGLGTALEKKRFGAQAHQPYAFVQVNDLYNLDVLTHLLAEAGGR